MNIITSKRRRKIRDKQLFLLLLLVAIPFIGYPQNADTVVFRVMFYNVENLFDTIDDPHKKDNEFLPDGVRHWTGYRYFQKLNRIAQVIIAAGENDFPVAIGMCEIENQQVLEDLLYLTPLRKLDYDIVHRESPDIRGIDVAFLYRKSMIQPQTFRAIPVVSKKEKEFTTRDILYVKGRLNGENLHFFVNHWPSKYGGVSASKPFRALAAITLRSVTDSLLEVDPQSKIIIMGDFNDSPFDKSVAEVLGAKQSGSPSESGLYTLAYSMAKKGRGSNKFRSKWDMIDQFIVSQSLIDGIGLSTSEERFQLFSPGFLLVNDKNYLGQKLNRTFVGYKYNGGFSDHLPVIIDLISK